MPDRAAPEPAQRDISIAARGGAVTQAKAALQTAQEQIADLAHRAPFAARGPLAATAAALGAALRDLTGSAPEERHPPRGSLAVLCGPMCAGKSRELLHRMRQANLAGIRTVLVVPRAASSTGVAKSRNGGTMPATPAETALGLLVAARNARVVFIDEAQLFPWDDLAEGIDGLLEAGKDVVAAGLDLDAFGAPFGGLPWALAAADEVVKLRAVCARCGAPASRTQRMADGEAVLAGPVVAADAEYEPRCSACWMPPSATRPADAPFTAALVHHHFNR